MKNASQNFTTSGLVLRAGAQAHVLVSPTLPYADNKNFCSQSVVDYAGLKWQVIIIFLISQHAVTWEFTV